MVLNRREYMAALLARDDDSDVNCGSGGGATGSTGLRIASVFIILTGSMFGALFPVLSRRTRWLAPHIPKGVFDFAKYFGSGVIIATAFIHLLDPATDELGSPCLAPGWSDYPYALAIALISIFMIFIVELIAFRWGTAKLAAIGVTHDAHGHGGGAGAHAAHGPEGAQDRMVLSDGTDAQDSGSWKDEKNPHERDAELAVLTQHPSSVVDSVLTQIIGVAILEFGVLLHSVLIGLTLAVTDDFITLFIVIIFHQMFEGMGVGSRLAYMELPQKYYWVPIVGALLYGITTPIGIAVGLGVRTTYNPDGTTASIVSGILDAFSAGILIYTGLVELLAHEFLFNKEMMTASNGKLAYALCCMIAGCGIMALLGRWA
ncbi:ZIP zinc/iron transport family [Phanerochaete sordida]|uniref:ZIP zinc/iron transport family n=1 Tax=Phanerochaete sordida TaxID=48140 RepID=A0A9P3LCI2_9APHY|nr:ZIP zinc/iron transport family [Phanerochaete sordida]